MMQLNPHLSFNGQCEAAFKFYEKVSTWQDRHADDLRGFTDRGTNASRLARKDHPRYVRLGGTTINGRRRAGRSYRKPQGFSVLLNIGDAAEADRIFQALAENGTVQMPIQETFWALRFGMLADQFGTPWLINCGKPA